MEILFFPNPVPFHRPHPVMGGSAGIGRQGARASLHFQLRVVTGGEDGRRGLVWAEVGRALTLPLPPLARGVVTCFYWARGG